MLLLVTYYSSSLTIAHHLLLLVVLRCRPFFKFQLSATFVVHCLLSLLATTHHLLWLLHCSLYFPFPFPPLGCVGGGTWNIQMPNSVVGLVKCFFHFFKFFFQVFFLWFWFQNLFKFFFVFAKTLEIFVIEYLIKFWKKLLLESKLETFTIL